MKPESMVCENCGTEFKIKKGRGRPSKKCAKCKKAKGKK